MPGKRRRSGAAIKGWKSRKVSQSPPAGNRPTKLKTWSNSAMISAIDAVKSGKMTANKAARFHEVPPSTLKDRLSGKVKHGANPGPSPYLSKEEETELRDFLFKSSEIGCGKTRREVIGIVRRVVEKKGRSLDNFNGDGWCMVQIYGTQPRTFTPYSRSPFPSTKECCHKRQHGPLLLIIRGDVERQ